MIPITTFKNGQILELNSSDLYSSILAICKEHHKDQRALAFAFILYNTKTPQVIKILEDKHYWNALNDTAGRFLSVFYIVQNDSFFAQDLEEHSGIEKRGLYEINTLENIKPILKQYFKLDNQLNLPAVLFFQVTDSFVSDYFVVGLNEEKVEEAFWELQKYIQRAVDRIEELKIDIYNSPKEIFEQLKLAVTTKQLQRQFFKLTEKFPFNLLVNWITEKLILKS